MKLDLVSHQRYVEHTYSKKNINKTILAEIEQDSELMAKVEQAVELVEDWMQQSYYPSKDRRLAELSKRGMLDVIKQILVVTIQVTSPMLFTAVVGEITSKLKMSNKIDGTKTAAEMLAIISDTDLFDIYKEDAMSSVLLLSNYTLDDRTIKFIEDKKYLPPMVVSPCEVMDNFDYAYLTEASSLILGNGNYHEGDICLDSINKFNQVPLCLNERLLKSLSERPKRDFVEPEKKEQWRRFVLDSYETYRDLIQVGNRMWLTHKVDKRGRTYAQGYHVSTQGNEFRKAIIDFADKEVIEL